MEPPSQQDPNERAIVLRLKEIRTEKGISANVLAAKIKVDRSTITHMEADRTRPTLWLLLKIADGLDVKLSDVLEEQGC
ncbi:MAG: helix-turn-helix domain-containing protein [Prosthecobacter sp.]|nr:helix-turn-helix domain-containing protein [Prosthecobacter sp.]